MIKKILNSIITDYWKFRIRSFYLIIRNGFNLSFPDTKLISVNKKNVHFEIENSSNNQINNTDLIFSTDSGIFILLSSENKTIQILEGKIYGLCYHKGYWIFSRSNNYTKSNQINDKSKRQSDICAIKILGTEVVDYKILIWGIVGEVHQIDVFKNSLYFPVTGFNLLVNIPMGELFLNDKPISKPKTFFSLKSQVELKIFRPSHLNSIFYSKLTDNIYLIAHNSTAHTNRNSDIIVIHNNNRSSIINTTAHSSHNIYEMNDGETLIYCDSNNRKLMMGNLCLFESDTLLRGLAITESSIFVGGSDIDFIGNKRMSSNCFIYQITKDGDLVKKIKFFNLGNIKEVRVYNGKDYGLSL